MAELILTHAARSADNLSFPLLRVVMHFLAFMIELAAIVTPIVGIVVEIRRDISDDDGGSLVPAGVAAAPQPLPTA
jgi:hypothetical protein